MSSGSLTERDRAILAHVGRHWLSFREIIGELFFEGRNPQKALDALRADGFLRVEKGFGGNRSSYQLTAAGAKAAGMPPRRGQPLGSQSLPTNLAILSFCFLKNRPRMRLEVSELKNLFRGSVPPGRNHCVERGRKIKRVYHVYVPEDSLNVDAIVRTTRKHVTAATDAPVLDEWLANRVYSHAVLVGTDERRAEISAAMDTAEFERGRPLRQVAHIHVERVPGFSNLEDGLNGLA